jgi:integrase
MANSKGRRRRFGSIRRLPSGRYQARYPGPDGVMRPADDTFATKTEADNWLTRKEAEILDDEWIDPDAGAVLVADYAANWIEERPGLRPKSVKNYRSLLRCQVAPYFERVTVTDLDNAVGQVRRWRKKLLDSGTSPITTAKAYRFLRAVMNTAVDDGLIKRTPCRIRGAGSENSPERPVLSVEQVYALADAVGLRYRALILLAAFSSLRWSELAALTPSDINLDACTVRVTRQLNKSGAVPVFGPPKSRAGRRVVNFAGLIAPDLRRHLRAVPPGTLVFTSPEGMALSNTNFRRRVWLPALAAVGLEGVHIHDLRHTGNQFTADAGANTKELMVRMGHDSERAALIYLHSSDKRQRTLADAVAKAARVQLAKSKKAKPGQSGTRVARDRDDRSKN